MQRPMLSVRALFATYLAHAKGSKRYLADTRSVLDRFCSAHGDRSEASLTPLELLQFVQAHPGWKSDWTRRRVLSTVQRPWLWGVRMGVVTCNPFRAVTAPPGERGRPMTDDEYRILLREGDAAFRRVLFVMKYCGIRTGECSKILWENTDLLRGVVVLHEHKTKRTRRDRRPRVIYLPPLIVRLLSRLPRINPHVLLNSQGRPWTANALFLRMYRARERLGLKADCKLYGLRHRFGTQAAKAGVPLKHLAELLGHTTTRMAEYYVDLHGQADVLHASLAKIQ